MTNAVAEVWERGVYAASPFEKPGSLSFSHSNFIRHWAFVIRHSALEGVSVPQSA